MKSVNKYYKGILRCEFQAVGHKKLGNSSLYSKQSTIILEPRFRFDEVVSITEEEYLSATASPNLPFIKRSELSDVEFTFISSNDHLNGSSLKKVEEIVLFLNNHNKDYVDGERYVDSSLLANYIIEEKESGKDIFYSFDKSADHPEFHKRGIGQHNYYSPFEAFNDKVSHGKIKGQAYCKEVQYIDELEKPLTYSQLQETEKKQVGKTLGFEIPDTIANKGCFGKPISSRIIDLNSAGPIQRRGCFGNGAAPVEGLLPGGQARGCFGSQNGGGCFPLLGNGGAGCMYPILLLLLLGALLWSLLNMRGCEKNQTPPPVIIHDTIKVEVQKIDTLTIVKTDTVSYVDSTVKLNYETVNLPNVQFITNSDVLLPSSASDLQKLAEYLIKNDSLKATIFGHTDNVGKPEENLKLSQRRAESVKDFLTRLGVDGNRLKAVGKGDTEPKADNSLEEGRLMNRRVEVQLTNTEVVTTTRSKKEEKKLEKK